MTLIKELLQKVNPLPLLFPPVCLICGATVELPDLVCPACLSQPEPTGLGQWRSQAVVSENLDEVWTAYWFDETMRQLIHLFKYGGFRRLGRQLASIAWEQLRAAIQPQRFAGLVPVPLHRIKSRARGFNQAAVLATEIGTLSGLPVGERWVIRRNWTQSQTGLTLPERRANVTGCFQVRRRGSGEDILLVDDMLTTGATTSACAQALKAAGYGRIAVLTLATTRKEE